MPAPMFTVNAHRYDPYRTFKFQVVIDGRPVAGLKKMSALKKKTEAGGTSYEPVTLEQGLTHDTVFEDWANLVNNIEGDAALSLKNYRKDLVINVLNLQGQVAMSYKLFRSWVSEFMCLRSHRNRSTCSQSSSTTSGGA